MREQRYPVPNKPGTAPGADLTARSLNQTGALPAHLSTRITRIATCRAWTVDVTTIPSDGRARRQCNGYTETRALGEWDSERLHAAVSHASKQHNGATTHLRASAVIGGADVVDAVIVEGEIGDGVLTGAAQDRWYSMPRPIVTVPGGAIDSDVAPDDVAYDAARYAWISREMGCYNLAGGDLMDCTQVVAYYSPRSVQDWLAVTIGAEPTQSEPRCTAQASTWYPSPGIGSSTSSAILRVTAMTYMSDPE